MYFKRVFARKVQICNDDEVNKDKTTTILPDKVEDGGAQNSISEDEDET